MFNNYFKSDKNNIEFLFANVTVKNVDFALISLSALLDGENIDYNLYNDEHTFCFFHIQSLLTACGNIYNVFYGFSSKLPSHNNMYRTTLLRNTFGINKSRFPLVFQKEVRNTNEHFDERFDALDGRLGDYNIVDQNTPHDMRDTILREPHLRTFNRTTGHYYTYDRQFHQIIYNLHDLRNELLEMRAIISTHPMFHACWVDQIPDENVEH